MKLPEVSKNPLGIKMTKVLSKKKSNKIDFDLFVKALNDYNSGNETAKLKCTHYCFKQIIYQFYLMYMIKMVMDI